MPVFSKSGNDWKRRVLADNIMFHQGGDIVSAGLIRINNQNLKNYLELGGTDLFGRSKIVGTTSYYETRIIYEVLNKMVRRPGTKTVLDLGCGDGRNTLWFLKNTDFRIIAVDAVYDSLCRLRERFLKNRRGYRDRVLLLHSNILEIPLRSGVCDFIWAFETLYYLNEGYEKGIKECHRLLKRNGILANAERNVAGGLLFELLNNGVGAYISSRKKLEVRDAWSGMDARVPLLDEKYLERLFKKYNLKLFATRGISAVPLFISYLRSKGVVKGDLRRHTAQLIKVLVEESEDPILDRVTIYFSRRIK